MLKRSTQLSRGARMLYLTMRVLANGYEAFLKTLISRACGLCLVSRKPDIKSPVRFPAEFHLDDYRVYQDLAGQSSPFV